MCISQAFFKGDSGMRTLVNLPPSHVGCQTELLMGTFFAGGTAIILAAFEPPISQRRVIGVCLPEPVGLDGEALNVAWDLMPDLASL